MDGGEGARLLKPDVLLGKDSQNIPRRSPKIHRIFGLVLLFLLQRINSLPTSSQTRADSHLALWTYAGSGLPQGPFLENNLSQTEIYPVQNWSLEMVIGAFLQTPAPVLDKISGPMGARFLSSTGLGSGNLIGRAQLPPAPALDKNWSPNLFPLKVGLRRVFVNGLKWDQKWVFGCKSGSKVARNPLFTLLKPISGFSREPTFYPV